MGTFNAFGNLCPLHANPCSGHNSQSFLGDIPATEASGQFLCPMHMLDANQSPALLPELIPQEDRFQGRCRTDTNLPLCPLHGPIPLPTNPVDPLETRLHICQLPLHSPSHRYTENNLNRQSMLSWRGSHSPIAQTRAGPYEYPLQALPVQASTPGSFGMEPDLLQLKNIPPPNLDNSRISK